MRDARINGTLCLVVLTDEWKKEDSNQHQNQSF